jgi:hypothetical protein
VFKKKKKIEDEVKYLTLKVKGGLTSFHCAQKIKLKRKGEKRIDIKDLFVSL